MNYKLSIINCPLSIIVLITVLFALPAKAQLKIGDNSSAPHSFSMLELATTLKKGGLRLPQLTTHQCDSIANVLSGLSDNSAEGLLVYNTDIDCVEFWNGGQWISLCSDIDSIIDPDQILEAGGSLTGRTCFDIASPFNDGRNSCGSIVDRTVTADFTTGIKTQVYTFTPPAGHAVSKLRFIYLESDSGKIVQSMDYDPAYKNATGISANCSVTVVYKESLNSDALGLTRDNPLTVDIYAVFNDSADGTGTTIKKAKLTATIMDCGCATP